MTLREGNYEQKEQRHDEKCLVLVISSVASFIDVTLSSSPCTTSRVTASIDVPGGWPGDSQNWFTREGRSDLQNKAWDYLQTLLKWRKGNKIISEGNMKHYMPQLGVYVYERYLEGKSVMVIINGANHEVDLPLARYKESLKEGIEGKDIITKRTILFKDSLKLASKEVLVVEMN